MFDYSLNVVPPHNRQIQCRIQPGSLASFRRSIFGLVNVYNRLDSDVVEAKTKSSFQSRLQNVMKTSASNDDPEWWLLFHAPN